MRAAVFKMRVFWSEPKHSRSHMIFVRVSFSSSQLAQIRPCLFWQDSAWPEHRGGPAQLFLGSENVQKDSQPLKLHFIGKPK